MKEIENIEFKNKTQMYNFLKLKLTGLISDEKDWIANFSNASALLNLVLKDINWVGFYFYKNGNLVLGPFQGKPACVNLQIGVGVCGTAALKKETQLVKNVHEFPNHVACDSASNSEIVIPIIIDDKVAAVLDIDSPFLDRFDEEDKLGLEKFVEVLKKYIDFSKIY